MGQRNVDEFDELNQFYKKLIRIIDELEGLVELLCRGNELRGVLGVHRD